MITSFRRLASGLSLALTGIILLTAVNLTAPLIAHADAGVLYAARTVQGWGDCSSWANACTLQTALTNAVNGNEIWVKAGAHYPTSDSTDRSATFTLKNGVALYGGFAGSESSLVARDWQTNLTILSGDIDNNDTNTDGNCIAETAPDIVGNNSYHVVNIYETGSSTVLDGFIITAGQANDSGGGMYNDGGAPKLRDLIFSGNTATWGGGMYNDESGTELTNVTFSGNTAAYGGGMYNASGNPTLRNVTFSGNNASNGGGMFDNAGDPILNSVTFSGNSAFVAGGGLSFKSSQPSLFNVSFDSNAAVSGGGMNNTESNPYLHNVTFSGNFATKYGGGIYNNHSDLRLRNSILWGNTANSAGPELYNVDANPSIGYSDIKGCGGSGSWNGACGTNSGGNIDADPLFVNALEGNLRLSLNSPAIDAGRNDQATTIADLDGNPRFMDVPSVPDTGRGTAPIVDMGAYETYKILYASPKVTGSGDCFLWANACTLKTALTKGLSGREIWVKEGVHLPGTASDRAAIFTLKNGVALYGGFAGTETSLDQRDWHANLTILSGDIDNNDANTDGNFIAEMAADSVGDNAYHVVSGGATDSTAVLDGFIITAGKANGAWPHNSGGGMYNNLGNPTLRNLIFSGNTAIDGGGMNNQLSSPILNNISFSSNTATNSGGGMFNNDSSPTLTEVTFSGNTTTVSGGGMFNHESSPTLTNVTFDGNIATDYAGGAMYNDSSSPTLTNVTFSGNTGNASAGGMNNESSSPTLTNVTFSGNTAYYGGGMTNSSSSNPTLTNVTFSDNTADYGGGMSNWESSPTLTSVTFNGNTATGDGGGMYNYGSSPTLTVITFSGNIASGDGGGVYNNNGTPMLTDVTFSGNTANSLGGGMYNDSSMPTLTNVTFSGNNATNSVGGMFNFDSRPTLTNVILWGDSAPTGSEIYNNSNSAPNISYSDIQGCGGSGSWNSACGTNGGGNIDADPLFVDAAVGNLRLQPTSPAIDAGKNAAVPSGVVTDLDGNPRFVDILSVPDTGSGMPPIVDMGAYEVQLKLIFLPLILNSTSN